MTMLTADAVLHAAFSDALDAFRAFRCDQSCNGPSDVCLHKFAWPCGDCGATVIATAENMLGYDATEGRCLRCHIG